MTSFFSFARFEIVLQMQYLEMEKSERRRPTATWAVRSMDDGVGTQFRSHTFKL